MLTYYICVFTVIVLSVLLGVLVNLRKSYKEEERLEHLKSLSLIQHRVMTRKSYVWR